MRSDHASGANTRAQELFAPLPRRYDLLVDLLSFGQNRRWRRAVVDRITTDAPGRVLDVATGTAGIALQVAERSAAQVCGVDVSEPMLRQGQQNIGRRGARDRVVLVAGAAERLPFPDAAFDAVAFSYLLRYVDDPDATLRELARVLRPGGMLASLDFCVPANPFWRASWWLYTRLALPAAGSLWGRGWYRVGRFLGPNISEHHRRFPIATLRAAWSAAGIVEPVARPMSLGGGLVMCGRKRDG